MAQSSSKTGLMGV